MEDIDILLSDQFIVFSERITQIAGERKKLKEAMKAMYAEFQEKIKNLNDEAMNLQVEFEEWKKTQHKQVKAQ